MVSVAWLQKDLKFAPVRPIDNTKPSAAGTVVGEEPSPGPPVSGFAARTLSELPDQIGFWHRDDVAVVLARYERLRAP